MAATSRTDRRPRVATLAVVLAVLGVAGCSGGGLAGSLRAAGVAGKPDEFMVLPTRPLEMPADMTALPTPAPGTPNRVDYQPRAEAIAGLSGRPGAPGNADGTALVVAAGPRDPNVRAELAVEDAEWRRVHRGRLLERLIIRDPSAVSYAPMVLDVPLAFEQARAAGKAVPAATPKALDQ